MEEEKGFVIKDRRSFDEKGELKKEGDQPERKTEKQVPKEKPKEAGPRETGGADESQRVPLPEVNFNSLIFSLSSSALLHLGEIDDPYSGKKIKDLSLAKHTIDTIGLLKSKTKGNLTDEETKFLESVLADLRWRFVKATEKA
jgi:hypothetical protein